jgi:hypothetical protein
MMFGGKILVKTRKTVEGSYRQESYSDSWQDSIDIAYDGELTHEVCEAIKNAFYKSKARQKPESGYGQLRWSAGDYVSHIDVAKKQLILSCSVNICD